MTIKNQIISHNPEKLSTNYKFRIQNLIHTFTFFWDRFLFTRNQKCTNTQTGTQKSLYNYHISFIIPVYNGSVKWLKEAIESILNQTDNNWQLCIVDDNSTNNDTIQFLKEISDPRIQVTFLSVNQGISHALNTGINMSKGSYVTFLDQDDIVKQEMLKTLNEAIQRFNPDIVYTDESFYYQGFPKIFSFSPHFKSDYSPDLLLSHNYITHLMVLKREILNSCGLFRSEFDGAQDYDLILRASEYANTICHIRKVLYHWRIHPHSTSNAPESGGKCTIAGKKALDETLKRRIIVGTVEHSRTSNFYKIKRTISGSPLISIIIPFKDQPDLMDSCLGSIYRKTSYSCFEIILVDNNSQLEDTKITITKWLKILPNIRVIQYPHSFNYSAINNFAVSRAFGEYIILMNNDIEIISPDWIETLLQHAQREEVGAVGGKLLYKNGSIQHPGIAVGIGGVAGCPHKGFPGTTSGYMNHVIFTRNVSAVTGALLMVETKKYLEIGGLDEINLKISLNDVDFCLRLIEKGYFNVYSPDCEAIHAESISRGEEDTPEKIARFKKEASYLKYRHKEIFKSGDPWYNPNLSLKNEKMRFERSISEEQKYGVFRRGENGRMYYEPVMGIDT